MYIYKIYIGKLILFANNKNGGKKEIIENQNIFRFYKRWLIAFSSEFLFSFCNCYIFHLFSLSVVADFSYDDEKERALGRLLRKLVDTFGK